MPEKIPGRENLIENPGIVLATFQKGGVIKQIDGSYVAEKPRWEKGFDVLVEQFPEIKALHGVVENNIWHDHDDAFAHTRNVYKYTQEALQFAFVEDRDTKKALNEYFQEPLTPGSTTTRKDVLDIAAVLHDIAKSDPEEMTREDNTGYTYFPTHDISGAQMSQRILERHNYEPAVIERVKKLITLHLEIHKTQQPQQRQEVINEIQANHPDIFPDLLVLSMADMQGSDLAKLNYTDYKERMDAYYIAFNELTL